MCGETQGDRVVNPRVEASNLAFEDIKKYFVGLESGSVFFRYKRCVKCRTTYCTKYFTEEQIDLLYEAMPDNSMGHASDIVGKTQAGYAKFLKNGNYNSILEIGPDTGLFAKAMVSQYRSSDFTFVEKNYAVYPDLKKLSNRTTKVRIVQDLSMIGSSYPPASLIVAIHVIDHLPNPVEYLKKLHNLSGEQTQIMIVVHNHSSLLRRILGRNWPPFCLQHPQLFNPKSMNALLSQAGWVVERQQRTINHLQLNVLLNNVLSVFARKPTSIPLLPQWKIALPLGNFITIAKKS